MKRALHVNQETINAMLPPIPVDFERDMREMILSMPAERVERKAAPMKRSKLSVGFILVIVFSLMAVSALAAVILGGKDFVDQVMAPKAAETQSEKYTRDEVQEILRIAKENNLTLSDDIIETLNRTEDGYWKEELMRLFVKTEYGFYPAAWPIEVQHWYEQMLKTVGCDYDGPQVNVLPEGNELTQDQILKIAQDYIHEKYDANVDLEDKEKYLRFLTYQEHKLGQDASYREWALSYEAQDLYGADYVMTLDSAGTIKKEYRVDGIWGADYEAHGQNMRDRFVRVYGDHYGFVNWTSEIMLEYQQAMLHRQTLAGPAGFLGSETPILDMVYLTPDDTMISREEAIEGAKAACGKLDYETLYGNSQVAVCMENPDGKPVWKVTLGLRAGGFVYAQLDAKTGEALLVDTAKADSYTPWRVYVSEEYWQENKPTGETLYSRPAAGDVPGWRLPAFWGDTAIAPSWYWDRLNAVGYSEETEDTLYLGWLNQYGYDTHFWPLEAQAIEILAHESNDETDFTQEKMPGLPSEGDISQEEALTIAKAAFKQVYAEDLPGLDVSTLKGAFSYWFRRTLDFNVWEVNLYRLDGVKAGTVWIESRSGQAYELESPDVPGIRSVENDLFQPIATPAPLENGKPWMWGNEKLPPSFWDKLEQVMNEWHVTAENIGEKESEWYFQYTDEIFMPYDCQVMLSVLSSYNQDAWQEDKPMFLIFPQEGKLSREEVTKIAWKALHEAADGEVGAAWIDDLKCNADLSTYPWVAAQYQSDEPLWCVAFFTWDDTYDYWNSKAYVYLTEDGEVILAELELGGNG